MFKPFFPPHIYQKKTIYFLTAHTRDGTNILATEKHKQIFLEILNEIIAPLSIKLYAWTINLNHYHSLIYLSSDRDLSRFVQTLHGKSSFLINKLAKIRGRRIWVNYWDRCIRSEKDFFTRLNYIHYNPVKHGYVKETASYPWSSYHFYLEKYGLEWLADCWSKYPITNLVLEDPD